MGSNQILTLENETFSRLPSLNFLDLSNNLIYSLNDRVLANLFNLQELILIKNNIEELDKNCFTNLSIKVLDLSENKLKYLKNDTWILLRKLSQI